MVNSLLVILIWNEKFVSSNFFYHIRWSDVIGWDKRVLPVSIGTVGRLSGRWSLHVYRSTTRLWTAAENENCQCSSILSGANLPPLVLNNSLYENYVVTGTCFDKIDINSLLMWTEVEFRESSLEYIRPSALWLVNITSRHSLMQDLRDRCGNGWRFGSVSWEWHCGLFKPNDRKPKLSVSHRSYGGAHTR